MSKGYIKAIQTRIKKNIRYFERNEIFTDKLDYIAQSLNPKTIEAAWKSKELVGLSYDEKVKKIASIATFPSDMSILQAESIVVAAQNLGQELSFKDVLRGKFDWSTIKDTEEILVAEAIARGLTEKQARKSARIAISQQYFGSL